MAEELFHSIENTAPKKSNQLPVNIVLFLLVICLGILSGYLVTKIVYKDKATGTAITGLGGITSLGTKTTAGAKNEKLFPDVAEGTLKSGGIDGEGSHHLIRTGGASQNVYLTSSVVDLNQYLNKKVKVWGKTYAAQTAGWLMDVGYLEVK